MWRGFHRCILAPNRLVEDIIEGPRIWSLEESTFKYDSCSSARLITSTHQGTTRDYNARYIIPFRVLRLLCSLVLLALSTFELAADGGQNGAVLISLICFYVRVTYHARYAYLPTFKDIHNDLIIRICGIFDRILSCNLDATCRVSIRRLLHLLRIPVVEALRDLGPLDS